MPEAAESTEATAASFQQQPAAILSPSRALTATGRQWKERQRHVQFHKGRRKAESPELREKGWTPTGQALPAQQCTQ
ncbi:hypothetical protein MHYP_G00320040 [Metynnis hypsauchen]